jgi:hypothetical protein
LYSKAYLPFTYSRITTRAVLFFSVFLSGSFFSVFVLVLCMDAGCVYLCVCMNALCADSV